MRLSLNLLPLLMLVALPLVSSCKGWNLTSVLLSLVVIFIVREIFIISQVIKKKRDEKAGKQPSMILETIHISHYVEKVRWVLDYLNIPYKEEPDVGILGGIFMGRTVPTLKVPSKNISISNSSDILRYLYGLNSVDSQIGKSEAIDKFLFPSEEALKMEKELDKFGEDARAFIYNEIFTRDNTEELTDRLWGLNHDGIPSWQKLILRFVTPVAKIFVSKFAVVEPESAKRSHDATLMKFQEIENLLSDGRKYLLSTPTPTFIDFHFAAMAALVLFPETYGGRSFDERSKGNIRDTGKFQEECQRMRETRAGKFVMELYEKYRLATI